MTDMTPRDRGNVIAFSARPDRGKPSAGGSIVAMPDAKSLLDLKRTILAGIAPELQEIDHLPHGFEPPASRARHNWTYEVALHIDTTVHRTATRDLAGCLEDMRGTCDDGYLRIDRAQLDAEGKIMLDLETASICDTRLKWIDINNLDERYDFVSAESRAVFELTHLTLGAVSGLKDDPFLELIVAEIDTIRKGFKGMDLPVRADVSSHQAVYLLGQAVVTCRRMTRLYEGCVLEGSWVEALDRLEALHERLMRLIGDRA